MDNENKEDQPNVQADNNSIAVGGISIGGDIRGDITIGHTGYTVEQVSVLLAQITSTFQPKPFDGRCPYKGLEVFDEEDAELFFGRERLIEDLVSRVEESRTVFITGPSGSGKSSLVRAGLIHALKQGAIKNLHSERWLYETMKPGREPIKDLALAFSRLKSPDLADYFQAHASEKDILNKCAESVLSGRKDQRFVLFIDQFEEVFTQITQNDERLAFLNMLAHAATVENGRLIILFAMRSDFVSNCATYPALNELLSQQFRQIGAMQPEELVSAIALPAKHVGLPIEDELIARIINDMKGEPGALPLMQFALKDLFDAQQEKGGVIALTLEDYLRHGGIHKSLERHADKSFATLSETEQELARSIFSGLIEIGRGTQDTRRTALFDELVPANTKAEEVEAVVQRLADARLIITDEQAGKDTVTISHEKLIDAWPWLKKLVNENRDVIALQNEIASDVKDWEDHKRDPSYLYTGARLANTQEQLTANKLVLSGAANEFVRAGIFRQQRDRRTRILSLTGIISLIVAGIILFSYISIRSSGKLLRQSVYSEQTQAALASTSEAIAITAQANAEEAQSQAKIARARELGTQAILQRDNNFLPSLLLAVEAFHTMDLPITRRALLDSFTFNTQLKGYLSEHGNSVSSVAFSPDDSTLASGSADNTIILWNVKTQQPIDEPLKGHSDAVLSIAFSPDGDILASGSADNTIILWDVKTQQPIGEPLQGHSLPVNSVAFSLDGNTLASGSDDKSIILWDVETRQRIGEPLLYHNSRVTSVAFSWDGNILASGDWATKIILWDVRTQQPIGEPLNGSSSVNSVAFSPDGSILASNGAFNTIILWDVETLQPIGESLDRHKGDFILSVAFSPDGSTLASGSNDKTIILWDVETLQPIGEPLKGHSDFVRSVAFSQDGNTLASGSDDKNIVLWDVKTQQPIGKFLTGHSVGIVTFSPDGNTLASGSRDGTMILWNVETLQPIGERFTGHSNTILSIAFSPDGSTLASGSADNTIILWDVETRQPIGEPLKEGINSLTSVAFSPDGNTLASGSDLDRSIILWDVETRQPIGEPLKGHSDGVFSVAFSPDSNTLASGSRDKTIILWDVETLQPIREPLQGHDGYVYSVAFSPDGSTLASGGSDGLILWDVETRQPIGEPLKGHSDSVYNVAFGPDSNTLASGGSDGLILWDMETRQPIGEPLTGSSSITGVFRVAFSPDSSILASNGGNNTFILWDVNPRSWVEKSCQRAGRNFTRVEWALYIPNELYPTKQKDATCPQWPLEPEVIATSIP